MPIIYNGDLDNVYLVKSRVDFEDPNYNPKLRNNTIKIFRKKILKSFKKDGSYSNFLKYFYINEKNLVDIDPNWEKNKTRKLSDKDKERIIKFIMLFYMNDRSIAKAIESYRIKKYFDWDMVKYHKTAVKRYIYKKAKKSVLEDIKIKMQGEK